MQGVATRRPLCLTQLSQFSELPEADRVPSAQVPGDASSELAALVAQRVCGAAVRCPWPPVWSRRLLAAQLDWLA